MKRLGTALLLGLLLAACSSETAIVATLDLQGGAGSSFGGSSGSGAGGVAGAQQVTSGGARQESGGAPIQSGGTSGGSDGGSVGGSGATAGGAQFAAGGAQSGGAASGGATWDAGAGGVLTGDVPPMYCSCSESHTVCGSDGETHLCIGNQCPAIMIICDHECPCGAGETSVGGERGIWYPEECFDPGTCADTAYFCASNAPEGAAVVSDCATLQP